jgi:glycosyltransferase involved in cell wall biosynthesis
MKVSVVLLAINAEREIARCLKAILGIADEIIVFVDDKTTDKTAAVARKFTKNVTIVPHLDNFHINKQKAIEKATGDWILQLDVDEVVSEELADEVKKTITSDPVENGFWLPRPNWFLGRFLRKGGAYPDYTLRLYRRGKGYLPAKSVHEQAVVDGQTGYLKNDLLHYAYPRFYNYVERFNRYTDLQAKEVAGGFVTNMFVKPLFDSRQGFLTIYFRHLGFLDGFPGFVWALFSALSISIAYLKSLENKYGNLGKAL